MKTVFIPAFAVEQPIGTVFVAKMDVMELLRMSMVDRQHIDNEDEMIGIQRPLKQDKVREIREYLTRQNATIPNSIIVNIRRENVISQDKQGLEVKDSEDTFTIIDGQHRLYGFTGYNGRPFELILTIFIGLEVSLQSEVFSVINSQQTYYAPSISIDVVLSENTQSPRKTIVQIAQAFNLDKQSPWYQQIRMSEGQGVGMISLASFVRPINNLTYPERLWTDIKNRLEEFKPKFPSDWKDLDVDTKRYPFWSFYISQQPAVIYKILFNYFIAFSRVLDYDWMNQESILNKAPGYNAMMRLFSIVFNQGIEVGDLTEGFFFKILSPLSKMKGTITSAIYGSSELYSANLLYRDILYEIGLQEEDRRGADYDTDIEHDNSTAKAYLKRGVLKGKNKDYEGAIRDLDKAITLDPLNSDAYRERGALKEEINDFESAILDFNKAVELAPTIYKAYLYRRIGEDVVKKYMDVLKTTMATELEEVESGKAVK